MTKGMRNFYLAIFLLASLVSFVSALMEYPFIYGLIGYVCALLAGVTFRLYRGRR